MTGRAVLGASHSLSAHTEKKTPLSFVSLRMHRKRDRGIRGRVEPGAFKPSTWHVRVISFLNCMYKDLPRQHTIAGYRTRQSDRAVTGFAGDRRRDGWIALENHPINAMHCGLECNSCSSVDNNGSHRRNSLQCRHWITTVHSSILSELSKNHIPLPRRETTMMSTWSASPPSRSNTQPLAA